MGIIGVVLLAWGALDVPSAMRKRRQQAGSEREDVR